MARSDASASVSVERFLQLALLGLVGSGFLAVAGSGFLDAPTIALTSAAFLLRGLMAGGLLRFHFSDRALAIASACYAGFFVADLFLLSRNLPAAAVHLVFFLAVIKVLTAKAGRDSLYVAAIAVFELLAAALLSIDCNFFLALGLYVVFAIAALIAAEIRRSMGRTGVTARGGLRRFHPRLALLAGSIAMGILALTAGLFFVLPRSADAAFSRLARRTVVPGFSDQVTLGQIGEIKQSSLVVMHIRIFSSEPLGSLKWRGASLADFDGRSWSNLNAAKTRIPLENGHAELEADDHGQGRHLSYHVDYDALEANVLFFTGAPQKIDLDVPYLIRAEGGTYSAQAPSPRDLHYDAYSRLDSRPESSPPPYPTPILRLESRERYLQLPGSLDARIPALARSLAGTDASDLSRARAVEEGLRRGYRYSLTLPDRDVADPLSYFLFTSRKGHCEYFASAMAILLRTLGIPARVVTGFQGGEYNPITDLWVVRASDAHSWVEAWMPVYGWTTFDPTPPDPNARRAAWMAQLGLYLDAGRTFWRNWIVGYDVGRQGTLAGRVEQGAQGLGIRWYDALAAVESAWRYGSAAARGPAAFPAAAALGLALCLGLAAPPLVRILRMRHRVERVRRGQAGMDDATILYRRMLRSLKRQGYQKPVWFTPAEFAKSLPPGPLYAAVSEFTAAYNALRFGGRADVAPRLSILLEELERG
ncbi:MAG: DUF3488 and transglutaminase-like domain-containing protein [Bryobacteraceae bacterium]|jgi:hypothetical protein